jgi:hypothetical protein
VANALYFGDNLEVLRESIKGESVDLVYLDPPFNSNATYNVLFMTPNGHQSDAQIGTLHCAPATCAPGSTFSPFVRLLSLYRRLLFLTAIRSRPRRI